MFLAHAQGRLLRKCGNYESQDFVIPKSKTVGYQNQDCSFFVHKQQRCPFFLVKASKFIAVSAADTSTSILDCLVSLVDCWEAALLLAPIHHF